MAVRFMCFMGIMLVAAILVSCCAAVPHPGTFPAIRNHSGTAIVVPTLPGIRGAMFQGTKQVPVLTDPDQYIPLMSSTVGIRLVPEYPGKNPVKQTWETNFGHFVTWENTTWVITTHGRNITVGEGPVYWTYDPRYMGLKKPPVTVRLTITDTTNGTAMARGKVHIRWEDQDTARVIRPD